ncbi:MAG: FAD:protein FMN transferase [Candidatus Brocadia sp.]|nr:FAD:protein FMN transferase [Candidatus Brocadia sp.]
MKRQIFFPLLLLLWGVLPFSGLSLGQSLLEEGEPPENYQLQVFLEEEDAIAKIFAGCDQVESEILALTPEGLEYFKGLLKRPDIEANFEVFIGKKGAVIDRYAIITEEMGCFHPITWILSTNTEGKVIDVAVMIYRESRGQEVSRKRFLRQFEDKSLQDPLSTNKDIIKITGATTSVRAVCRGVKKMLAFIQEFYINKKSVSASLARRLTPDEVHAARTSQRQLFTTARVIEGVKAVVAAEADNERQFFSLTTKAFNEIERIERLFRKELQSMNKVAAKTDFVCSEEVFEVMKRCYRYGVITEGEFDITVAPLLEQWGMYRGKPKEVKAEKLAAIYPAVSYKNIKVRDGDKAISFAHKKTKVDLGPVIKGYAIDKAVEMFHNSGLTNVCMNFGSMSRMLYAPSGKDVWKIGVPHPEKGDTVVGALHLVNQGVAFVGDYSRYPAIQDKFSMHLIDPKTGRPPGNEYLAVIAAAPTAEEAGVAATVLFMEDTSERGKLATVFPDTEWLIVSDKPQNSLVFEGSPGMMEKFKKGEQKSFRYGRGAGCSFSP